MSVCPRCRERLIRVKTPNGFFFVCRRCQGRAVGLSVLRRLTTRESIKGLWTRAGQPGAKGPLGCPICRRRMSEVGVPVDEQEVVLDVCRGCQFVWFDPKELEQFPPKPPQPSPDEQLPEKVREQIALAEVKLVGERARAEESELTGPEETWKWIPGVLGMPVESGVHPVRTWPWLTWALAAALVLVFVLTFDELHQAALAYGFVPDQAWRYGGLTFLTVFFLHAGLFHLIGNTYFLLVFGDNVEDYLGRWRYAVLLLAATLAGGVAHLLADPASEIPCVGASGGISGVIVFYALKFPKARLGIFIRYWFLGRWLYMSAAVALVFWLLLQCLLAYQQLAGIGHVSALAHLGGAAVGAVAWLVWRRR